MCMWDWNFAGLERIDSLHSLFTPSSLLVEIYMQFGLAQFKTKFLFGYDAK